MAWPAASDITLTLAVGLPLAVYAAHAAHFGGWLIDDAGVSFAYARNLAAGHGLVSQPGAAPVEGFSNPACTVLLAALSAAGLFHPLLTPKLLAFALVAGTFTVLWHSAPPREQACATLATVLLALSTSFTVWTASGLENPLLAFLAALSCALALRASARGGEWAAPAGVVAGLLALTRPDAVLLAAGYPVALLVHAWGTREWRAGLTGGLRFAAGFLPPYGGYLAFRLAYYGGWVPNTYHAKEKPALAALLDPGKWSDLLDGALGPFGLPALALLVVAAALAGGRGRLAGRQVVLLAHVAVAAATYVVMPRDWMGEHRFATAFLVFFAWSLADLLGAAWTASAGSRRWALRPALAAAAALLVGLSYQVHLPRTRAFAQSPVTPFASVAAFSGDYDLLAHALGVPGASLLTPDVGGALYSSHLRVHDLVGLCDREAARTLTHDTAAFHRYVFGQLRPTFIHVHGAWSGWASLHSSSRFEQEYLPIHEAWGGPAERAHEHEREPWRGDYVRRDALGDDPAPLLARLRAIYLVAGMQADTF